MNPGILAKVYTVVEAGVLEYDDSTQIYEWSDKLPESIKDKPRSLFKNEQSFKDNYYQLIKIINDLDDIENNKEFSDYTYIFYWKR